MNTHETKAAYFQFIDETGSDASETIISAGAALMMFRLRKEVGDLDLDVTPEIYERYKTEENVRRSSLGEYVDYSDTISLHAKEHDPHPNFVMPWVCLDTNRTIYTYSRKQLIEQKIKLLEMEDRIPSKIPRDIEDLDGLIFSFCTEWAGGTEEGKDLIRRAGIAKAKRMQQLDLSQSET